MADTTILVTEEKEEDVVAVLIMNVLKTNEKVKNNLSLMAKK